MPPLRHIISPTYAMSAICFLFFLRLTQVSFERAQYRLISELNDVICKRSTAFTRSSDESFDERKVKTEKVREMTGIESEGERER